MQTRKRCRPNFFTPLPIQKPNKSNNLLHTAMLEFVDLTTFDNLIRTLEHDTAVAMSLESNNSGKLPIDLISHLPNDTDLRNTVSDVILDLMCERKIPSLKTKINVDEEVRKYPTIDAIQHDHFGLACTIINQVRDVIDVSFSHPDANHLKKQVRDLASREFREISLKIRDVSSDLPMNEFLKRMADILEEHRVGNCEEMVDLGLYYLSQSTNFHVKGEVFSLKKGDHVFLVIGRDPNSDPTDYATWGKDAIICDPWAGQAYPVSEIETKLHSHRVYYYDRATFMNYLMPFNPAYHVLKKEIREADNSYAMANSNLSFVMGM